ncbi:MAG TPA: N-acetyltransferase [Flavobacteriales bacterium]|nr:N-acetyltransferase [Flavobacteriales bacterium]
MVIGDNSVIANDCVIGEPRADYYTSDSHKNEPTIIGKNALIRSHTIIYEDVLTGDHFQTGHRVTIREKSVIGSNCGIGTNCDLQGYLTIGNHCHFHSDVHVCQFSSIGDFVFIYPSVVLANDKHPPTTNVKGPSIGNYTQIGIQSSIIGDVSIGENCFIGAATVITKSYANFSFIVGSPAIRKGDVRKLLNEDGEPLYPWKNRFSRGMPWHS